MNGNSGQTKEKRERERIKYAAVRGSSRRLIYTLFNVPPKARQVWVRDSWAGFLVGVYIGGIMPFMLVIARKQLHASETQIGLMGAAPFIGNLLALFWANAMEGRPKMPFVVWSCILARAVFILMLFVTTPAWYAAIVTASQFLATIAGPAYASIMKDVYPDAHRGRLMGYVRVVIALANVLTALLVGRLLGGQNYRLIFPIAAMFGIASSVVFRGVPTPEPPQDEVDNKKGTRDFLVDSVKLLTENRSFRWFGLSVFVFGFGNLILVPVFPIYQVDRLRFGTPEVAVLTMVFNVVWMFSYLFWGRYVDDVHPLRAVVVNVLLTLLIPLNYILAGAMRNPGVATLMPSAALSGITAAGLELAYFNTVIHFADQRRIATYMAIFSCLLGIRGSFAPFIGAALMKTFSLRHWDLSYLFASAMVIMFLGMLLQIAGVRHEENF